MVNFVYACWVKTVLFFKCTCPLAAYVPVLVERDPPAALQADFWRPCVQTLQTRDSNLYCRESKALMNRISMHFIFEPNDRIFSLGKLSRGTFQIYIYICKTDSLISILVFPVGGIYTRLEISKPQHILWLFTRFLCYDWYWLCSMGITVKENEYTGWGQVMQFAVLSLSEEYFVASTYLFWW